MPNLIVGLGLAMMVCNAGAVSTSYPITCFLEEVPNASDSDANCSTVSSYIECGTNGRYVDCASCNRGCTRTLKTKTIGYESFQYYACENCAGIVQPIVLCPPECQSEQWDSNGTGKEIRCVKGTSAASCEYRCAANYYGNGTTCTVCPSYNGIAGTSSAGSTSVSSCCIASGSTYSFSDDAGSGTATISSPCCAS